MARDIIAGKPHSENRELFLFGFGRTRVVVGACISIGTVSGAILAALAGHISATVWTLVALDPRTVFDGLVARCGHWYGL